MKRYMLRGQRLAGLLTAVCLAGVLAAPVAGAEPAHVRVVVQGEPGAMPLVTGAVERLGGAVVTELGVLDGVTADVSPDALTALRQAPGVRTVTPDAEVELAGKKPPKLPDFAQDAAAADDFNSLADVTRAVGAQDVWRHATGEGVGVALIDSGVAPVEGLDDPGQVVNGPDLSFDSQTEGLRHLDGYGHGTHMAGIIAGRDTAVAQGRERESAATNFIGVAPDAHIVNVKVGASDGSVDVSQVIAAIDWVVEHRDDPGLNIRVLNLSFGTQSLQDPGLDPLSFAAEVAWRKGIVVVVSGGNDGSELPRLLDPAINPYVIAVGAADPNGTHKPDDDTVPAFSSRGSADRRVDLVAPGQSVVSLRTPGSVADVEHPAAQVGERFFRGSGTSQAAAVVSGGVALLLERRPELTPDQVKRLLVSTAAPMPRADAEGRGAGLLNLKKAFDARVPRFTQTWLHGTGTGSLDAARGGAYVTDLDVTLTGERDIFGQPWDSAVWAAHATAETAWEGGAYLGTPFAGDGWDGTSFAATTWSARSWRDGTWAARSWRTDGWSARSWRGDSWSGGAWEQYGWSARSWRSAAS